MEYNIGFVIGDPSGDGHACTTDYHIVANHSADEISKAYKETTKLLGFDFIKEVGVDFQSDYWIPEKFTKELLKLGIIDEKYVRESDAEWGAPAGCYEFDYAEEEFVDLYFAIVKYSLPDLEWSSRDLEEETLLLVFDEVDKGFDLSRQVGMSNMYRNLHKKFNVSILAVTHTLFPILAREEMFYFEFRKMVSSKFYCWMKTGYNITAEKLEENERKED